MNEYEDLRKVEERLRAMELTHKDLRDKIEKLGVLFGVMKKTYNKSFKQIKELEQKIAKLQGFKQDLFPLYKGQNDKPLMSWIEELERKIQYSAWYFPQPPVSRDTSILDTVKVGEAEPITGLMNIKEHMEIMKEVKDKLIAEFIKTLKQEIEYCKTINYYPLFDGKSVQCIPIKTLEEQFNRLIEKLEGKLNGLL